MKWLILVLFIGSLFAFDVGDDFERTYTRAICEENVCQDYLFECLGSEVVGKKAISGFVTFDENWKDRREKIDFCDN